MRKANKHEKQLTSIRSAGRSLMLYYLVAVLICFAVIVSYQHFSIREQLAAKERSNMAGLAKSTTTGINQFINTKQEQLKRIAGDAVFASGDEGQIVKRLAELHKLQCPDTQLLFFADFGGRAFASLGGRPIQMEERGYFVRARAGASAVSNIRLSASTGARVISLGVPVFQNGKIIGVFGADLGIEAFLASTREVSFGNSGYIYIIDSDGMILSSPRDEQIFAVNVAETSSETLTEVSRLMLKEEEGFGRYVYEGIDKFVSWAKVPDAGWTVVVTSPVQEFYAASNSILLSVLSVTIALFTVVILLGVVIVKIRHTSKKHEYRSFHDNLTGLHNRAYFEKALSQLDNKEQLPLTVIMGDVNGLKRVNDTLGHGEGDKLLMQVAKVLDMSCRREDVVARWGGDEFIILSPRTDEETARNIIDRIEANCSRNAGGVTETQIAMGSATKKDIAEDVQEVLTRAEQRMYHHKRAKSQGRHSDVNLLKPLLWNKPPEEWGDFNELKELTISLGRSLGLSEKELVDLNLLILLHDVGQVAIPADILSRSSELNLQEKEIVEKHPEIGFQIANCSQDIKAIARAILTHHEWWNGEGYPLQIEGTEIPLLARIIAITTAYEAMRKGRPYRQPLSKHDAIKELQAMAGVQFDPDLVGRFLNLVVAKAS